MSVLQGEGRVAGCHRSTRCGGGGAVPQIHRMLGGAQKHRMPEGPVPQKHRMQGGATEAQDAWGQCHRSTGCPLETQKLEKH